MRRQAVTHRRGRGTSASVVVLLVLLMTLGGLASCSGDGTGDPVVDAGDRPLVVVTTSILGDVVARTLGDAAVVEVLIPDGAEMHDAQPSARQRARLAEADLIVAIGLDLEVGYTPALRAAADDGVALLEVGARLSPTPIGDGASGSEDDQVAFDPHVWTDPDRWAEVPVLVVKALLSERPDLDAQELLDGAVHEFEVLIALRDDIEAIVAAVPPERRRIVTDHDVLGYFAERYGFEVVGAVIPSFSTSAGASASDLAALAEVVRREDVPAIFTDAAGSDELARALADEVGADVAVVPLRLESIGDAEGWAEVLLDDARTIAEALAP